MLEWGRIWHKLSLMRSVLKKNKSEIICNKVLETMPNALESEASSEQHSADRQPSGWVKLGVVAAASVLAGGLEIAWWYRSTVKKLNQEDQMPRNPHFGMSGDDPEDG